MKKLFSLFAVMLFAISAWADNYLPGTWNSWAAEDAVKFVNDDVVLHLTAGNYQFKVKDTGDNGNSNDWFSVAATMTRSNANNIEWELYVKNEDQNEVVFTADVDGDYTFHIVWKEKSAGYWCPYITAHYPMPLPTAPTHEAGKVKAVYSSTYSANCNFGEWGGGTVYTQETAGKKYVNGANGYFGLVDFSLNCATMEKLHLDVYPLEDMTMRVVPIWGGTEQGITTSTLTAGEWNSVEIELSAYTTINNWSNIYQIKIDNVQNKTFYLNNVYFYTTQDLDTEAPVMGAASLESVSYSSAILNVAATDNRGVTKYVVKNGDALVGKYVPNAGKITVTGLTEGTAYTFSVYAEDGAENISENHTDVELTTTAYPAAAAAPNVTNKEYLAIYADGLTLAVEHSFNLRTWGGAPYDIVDKSGNHYILYNTSATNWTAWGADNDGAEAIVGVDAVKGTKGGVNASEMEYLHIDVYSMQACASFEIQVNDTRLGGATLAGTGWQSFDLPLSAYSATPARDWGLDNVNWMKFVGINGVSELGIDNVYFWKAASDAPKPVVATVNDANMGTAVVKQNDVVVTEVDNGTDADFIAEANDGYLFLGWYQGQNLISTENPYTVENITATTSLQAKFRAYNNIYCHTAITNEAGNKTIYLTMKRVAENQYQVVIDSEEEMKGFSNAYIGSINGGSQIKLNDEDIKAQHVTLSANKHRLTVDVTSTTPIKWNTPIYINMPGEIIFNQPNPQGQTVEYDVTCDEVVVTSLTMSQTEATLDIDGVLNLSATAAPIYADNQTITWTSSAPEIASVVDGVVTGHVEGNATITATIGSVNATCEITVALDPSVPHVAAPTPTHAVEDVINVYCTQYGGKAAGVGIANSTWNWKYTSATEKNILSTTHYLVKDCGSFGLQPGTSVSGMNYLHVDLWAMTNMNGYIKIENTVNHHDFTITGGQWTSIDVDVTDLTPGQNWIMVYLGDAADNNGKTNNVDLYVTNVYFWKNQSYDLTTEDTDYYTLYLPFEAAIPDEISAFAGELDGTSLVLHELDETIPAETAVLVKSTAAGSYSFVESATGATLSVSNDLKGVAVATEYTALTETGKILLTLGVDSENVVAFRKPKDGETSLGANKAYLLVDASMANAPIRIIADMNTATDLGSIEAENVVKFIENGQILIKKNGVVYNVMGQVVK